MLLYVAFPHFIPDIFGFIEEDKQIRKYFSSVFQTFQDEQFPSFLKDLYTN